MNTIVTAEIDVATPTGRRIVHDLERHKRTVKLNYPTPESITGKTYTHEEEWSMVDKSKAKKNIPDRKLETLQGLFPEKKNYRDAEFLAFNSMYNMAEIIESEI
ncbi:MAG: hypothetical protein LBN71_02025 [Tannerella sp.]|nr:hypothetical protein [Tannerella sp.]